MTVTVQGESVASYSDANVAEVVSSQRQQISCPELRQLVIKGEANGKLVYQGIARASSWSVRSTPILSGADAIAAADPPRPDPSNLPPADGYRLSVLPDSGSECANRMRFAVSGPTPMSFDNRRFVDAVANLAKTVEGACPQLDMLTLIPPSGVGSRFSYFSVRKREDWLPPSIFAPIREQRQAENLAQTQAMNARTKPTADTPNPLRERGYYASDFIGRGIDFSVYRAWVREQDFSRRSYTVVVHDARARDAAIIPIRYTTARSKYLPGRAFIDELNDTLVDAGDRIIAIGEVFHYVDGVSLPNAMLINASTPGIVEQALFRTMYDHKRVPIYTVPQAGAAKSLFVSTDPGPNQYWKQKEIWEEKDPLGADNVLTVNELMEQR